jgi:hypothetical protein
VQLSSADNTELSTLSRSDWSLTGQKKGTAMGDTVVLDAVGRQLEFRNCEALAQALSSRLYSADVPRMTINAFVREGGACRLVEGIQAWRLNNPRYYLDADANLYRSRYAASGAIYRLCWSMIDGTKEMNQLQQLLT